MFDAWLDLEARYRSHKISRRELFGKALSYGLTTTAAFAFVSAVENPRGLGSGWIGSANATAADQRLRAVLVTIERRGDLGAVDLCVEGFMRGAEEFNYDVRVVEALQGEYQSAIEASAAEQPDLMVGLFPPTADPLERAARQFPNTYFANIIGLVPDGIPNLKSVWHKGQEGTYLCGALAGMAAADRLLGVQSDTFGAVICVENSEQHGFLAGYQQGFKATNSKGNVIYSVIGGNAPFEDPVKASQLALVLKERGAGIIGTGGGKSQQGVLSGAKRGGYLAIGMDKDQCHQYPDICLASMVAFLDRWVYDVMKEVRENRFQSGHHYIGLADGALDICSFDDKDHELGRQLPKVVADTIANMRDQILAGSLVVSATPDL